MKSPKLSDDELRAEFRSWLDKGAMPSDMQRSLWDEFYALQFRRDQWRGFREMVDASPEDARNTARYLVQYVFRCHVEAQASALRRFAYAGPDKRPMSFGRILRLVADRPSLYGQEASDEAKADLDALTAKVDATDTFVDKWVAHLDRKHETPPLTIADMNDVITLLGPLWKRWYLRVTDIGTAADLHEPAGWAEFLRLERVPGPAEIMYREHLAAQQQESDGTAGGTLPPLSSSP